MPHPFSDDVPGLLIEHRQELTNSAVSTEVILERGYHSILGKAPLKEAGFNKSQSRAPGFLIPLWSVNGERYSYQYKPNKPRTNDKYKPIKYENPPGSSVRIDVPPRCLPKIGDPNVPLFITEGVKKVDSLATAGVCAICLTGVWGFKGKNEFGAATFSADFDYIALKERVVYIVFDSDSSTNPKVQQAMLRLSEHLLRKGAKVRRLRLPNGPDGEKVGADDYLVQGHTIDEMITLEDMDKETIREAIKFPTESENGYSIENGIIYWMKQTQNGPVPTPLCNFNCHIHEYIEKDNGQEVTKWFRIAGTTLHGDPLPVVDVKTENFSSLNWVLEEWGLRAIIEPGQNIKDRLKHAIMLQSQEAPNKQVYTHLGWREVDGAQVYLSGGGGIGPDGQVDVDTETEDPLKRYVLLRPEGDRSEAFSISQGFLTIGDLSITLPIWTSMYLAPLASYIDTAFSVWYIGGSGSFKSVLSALALSHYGTFDHLTLPAGWDSTKNSLEKLLFLAKDAPLVIDDLYPGEDAAETRRLGQTAGQIIRAQGNRQARGRMQADTSTRSGYRPRGLLISSGEHSPGGHSQNSRILIVNMKKGDINRDSLTEAQTPGNVLNYNRSMAHYIQWISKNWDPLKAELKAVWEQKRDQFYDDQKHSRLSSDIASLYTGLYAATKFGVEIGAISEKESDTLRENGETIFAVLVDEQAVAVEELRPAKRFISIMSSLISQGRVSFSNVESPSAPYPEPGITHVGWHDSNGTYYFQPDGAHQAVYDFCQKSGQPFTVKPDAIWRDLKIQGISEGHETDRTKASLYVPGLGKRERVLKIKRKYFEN